MPVEFSIIPLSSQHWKKKIALLVGGMSGWLNVRWAERVVD